MKQGFKILFRIALVVFSYLLIMFLFSLSNGTSPENENNTVRPYFGEIEQAENDFVERELEKLNDK
jgi:hypothetical protein